MSIGTFGSFTQARLGIYAAQTGLSVTGNNIANINTHGYTRQKLDQTSFYAGGSDRYYSYNEVRVGNGVLCTGVSQLRDPYLDIRYRNEAASVGFMDSKLAGLESIQHILDEVGDGEDAFGILGAQFDDFFKKLEQLSDQTGLSEYDIQVRSSAETLTKLFRSYAAKLADAKKTSEMKFNQDVESVNKLLSNIRDLNSSIRKAQLHGDKALELRDQRNLLIDELSTYMKIDVQETQEDLGGGVIVDRLIIRLGDANPDVRSTTDTATLVDGVFATQLSLEKTDAAGQPIPNENLDITLQPLKDSKNRIMQITTVNGTQPSAEVKLADNDLFGALQAQREMLTEAGEFSTANAIAQDPDAASKRGIPYYQKTLDLLARKFAETFNAANQGYAYDNNGNYLDKTTGKPITDAAGNMINKKDEATLTDAQKQLLKQNGNFVGGNLFSNSSSGDDAANITAANISISKQWTKGPLVVNSFVHHGTNGAATTDSSNIAHMLVLMKEKLEYNPHDLEPNAQDEVFFRGSFVDMWINTGAVLGDDMMSTSTLLDTYYASAVQLDTNRSSVSSVDLNDEAMNLMQYSKSYNAACRLMTTIDSILDKLINNTGMIT